MRVDTHTPETSNSPAAMISPDQKGNNPKIEQPGEMPTRNSTKCGVSTKEATDDRRNWAQHVGPPKYNGNGESTLLGEQTRTENNTSKDKMITDTLSYDNFFKANPLWETHGGEAAASAP